jgi:DnaJ-class molecular chaperone
MTEKPESQETPGPGEDSSAGNVCPECAGSGRKDDSECPNCEGTGRVVEIEDGRTPPPEDIEKDPAYEPEGPLKGFKGG